jgi:predicted nuclease of predicted toxin-antitoxin system
MEIGLSHADDAEIVEFARRNDRVCVTFDHDFHSHPAMTRADGPSIILIRAEGLESAGQAETDQTGLSFLRRGNRIGRGRFRG